MITAEGHRIWKAEEHTAKVFKILQEEVDRIKEEWADGLYKDALLNAKQVGVIEGINKVLFMEVEEDEE